VKPTIIPGFGAAVPAQYLAVLAPMLWKLAETIRSDALEHSLPPDTLDGVELLANAGDVVRAKALGVSMGVSTVDGSGFTPIDWISVMTAAEQLGGISRQRVTTLLDEKKLRGEKVNGRWRIDAASVAARRSNQ
jgi:hypothetical protein